MKKVFKIKEGLSENITNRTRKMLYIFMGIILTAAIVFDLILHWQDPQAGYTVDTLFAINMLLLTVAVSYVARFLSIINANLFFYTDETGITRCVEINARELSPVNKLIWKWLDRKGESSRHFIKWADVTKLELRQHALIITTNKLVSNGDSSYHENMHLHEEIESFKELETIVRSKTGIYN